jgi:hypothetical protein
MSSDPQSNWATTYAGLIGERVAAVAWLPITADTPSVIADLRKPSFSFSGGALIRFASSKEIFLTWTQHYPYTLQIGSEADGTHLSLDRVRASGENPWGAIEDAQLGPVVI